jgi:hypothetical protein
MACANSRRQLRDAALWQRLIEFSEAGDSPLGLMREVFDPKEILNRGRFVV